MANGGGGSVDDLVGVVVCTDPEIVLWTVTVISGLAVHDRVVREAKPFMRHTPSRSIHSRQFYLLTTTKSECVLGVFARLLTATVAVTVQCKYMYIGHLMKIDQVAFYTGDDYPLFVLHSKHTCHFSLRSLTWIHAR